VVLGAFPAVVDLPEAFSRAIDASVADSPASPPVIPPDAAEEDAPVPTLPFDDALAARTGKAAKIADPVPVLSETDAEASQANSSRSSNSVNPPNATNLANPANSTNSIPSALPTSTAPVNVNATEVAEVRTVLGNAAWPEDFGQKIVWLAKNDRQSAQITLNPPALGPIEVSLNLDKGNANAVFVSANSEVRESIEMAFPRLREMFAAAGIELGQAQVSAESFRQPAHEDAPRLSHWTDDEVILAESSAVQARSGISRRGMGLVDIFA
jgi:flagellar hook-length control protein FliK